MVLSSVNYPNILLFIQRDEAITAEDIDGLIIEINKNRDVIKNLLMAKNKLMRDIDGMMRQRAKGCYLFSPCQILDYREFSEFYDAEIVVLSSYMSRLTEKMGQSRLRQEILKPWTELAAIHKRLMNIITLQERAIAVLQGMVRMAGQTINTLISK
ncbi:MAG: hypothetical protein FWC76_01060 [Defluviitaleaceae bacterium]|nr:hypothetical protein [Defluviitaleaceae bacterium]